MTTIEAYFLGLLTMLLILFPFWYLGSVDTTFKNLYADTICWKICNPDNLYTPIEDPANV